MKRILFILLVIFAFNTANAQKVIGFFPNWVGAGALAAVQYDKLTDIQLAFATPNATGTYSLNNPGYLTTLKANGAPFGTKVHISVGGAAQGSTGWSTIVASAGLRTTFANNLGTLVQTYDLDGINLDWEFPSAGEANNYALLAQEIRTVLDGLEGTMGKQLDLTAAVSPVYWNNEGINNTFIGIMDELYIMAFDASGACCVCGGSHHSTVQLAQFALDYWTTGIAPPFNTCQGAFNGRNVPAHKLVLGVPFYSSSWTAYNSFSASDPAGFYNDADGVFGGQNYNSRPMLEQKVDMVMNTYGGTGVFIWELSQDRSDQYSLLNALFNQMLNYSGPRANFEAQPSGICMGESITFNDLSLGSIDSRSWYFGVGATPVTDTGAGPHVVSYASSGVKNVSLIVTGPQGSDTMIKQVNVTAPVSLPVEQDFESFSLCGTSSNCGGEVCNLGNGWVNESSDNIDWRVDEGGTPSASTGPAVDHKPGTAAGNYVYLEASAGCNGQTSILSSPCIDLSNATSPSLSFWYHMFGGDMGELHVDVETGSGTTSDVTTAVVGNQGDLWINRVVDLSAFNGQTIKIKFRGITGTSWQSDVSLDHITVQDSTIDCNGDASGTAYVDSCGTCVAGNTGFTACTQDCNGDWGGTAYMDTCSTCVAGNTGLLPCSDDCNGDSAGTAYLDNCGVCVEGNTGLTACTQDCNLEWGGTAFVDSCSNCVEGSTGLMACTEDCNGDWGGTAFIDSCSFCTDGLTGLIPILDTNACVSGFNNPGQEEKLMVFPNPYTSETSVLVSSQFTSDVSVGIYAISGQFLGSQSTRTNSVLKIGKGLTPGMYFLIVATADTQFRYRLIKE